MAKKGQTWSHLLHWNARRLGLPRAMELQRKVLAISSSRRLVHSSQLLHQDMALRRLLGMAARRLLAIRAQPSSHKPVRQVIPRQHSSLRPHSRSEQACLGHFTHLHMSSEPNSQCGEHPQHDQDLRQPFMHQFQSHEAGHSLLALWCV